MKRIFSLLLVALLLVSAVPMAQATNDYTAGTQVTYDATADNDGDGQPDNTETYTVTVPAKLAPGGSGTVTLQGTWAADRYITVTSSQEIEMVNDINSADKKTLAVTFDGIGKRGSNTEAQTVTKPISVANITDALFGTWSGLIVYDVTIETRIVDLAGTTWQFNDDVYDYEWMSQFDYYSQSGIDRYPSGCDLTNGNATITDVWAITTENVQNEYVLAFVKLISKDGVIYVPENEIVASMQGWYTIPAGVEQQRYEGEISLQECIQSLIPTVAPILSYSEESNTALKNLQLIDWLYDNAIMQ